MTVDDSTLLRVSCGVAGWTINMKQLLITFKKKEMFILGNFKSNAWLEKKNYRRTTFVLFLSSPFFVYIFFPKLIFVSSPKKKKIRSNFTTAIPRSINSTRNENIPSRTADTILRVPSRERNTRNIYQNIYLDDSILRREGRRGLSFRFSLLSRSRSRNICLTAYRGNLFAL